MVRRMLQIKSMDDDSTLFSSLLDLCDSKMTSVGDIEIVCGDGKTVCLHKIVFNFAYPKLAAVLPNDDGKVVIIIPGCDSETVMEARNTLYLDGLTKPLETIIEEGFGSHITKAESTEPNDDINSSDEECSFLQIAGRKINESGAKGDWVTVDNFIAVAENEMSSDIHEESSVEDNYDSFIIVNDNEKNSGIIEEEYKEEKVKDENKNTKRSDEHTRRIYNSTMEALNEKDSSRNWKPLEETPKEDLVENLCMFLKSASKPDGTPYNASTLVTYHSGLARLLSYRDLDIRKDERFKKVTETL